MHRGTVSRAQSCGLGGQRVSKRLPSARSEQMNDGPWALALTSEDDLFHVALVM